MIIINTYWIIYWIGSMMTEKYIKANNETEAEKKFKESVGNFEILKIERR